MQRRIDWDQIPIVIESKDDRNPHNPHAAGSPQDRSESLGRLARQILLRRARRIAQN
jgi:hypothetical protein